MYFSEFEILLLLKTYNQKYKQMPLNPHRSRGISYINEKECCASYSSTIPTCLKVSLSVTNV